jgi:Zn-dependent metalloprotease
MFRLLLLFVFTSLAAVSTLAQQSLRVAGPAAPPTGTAHYGKPNEAPRAIVFDAGKVTAAQFLDNIHTYLGIPAEFTFTEQESNIDQLGMRHRFLQQYYQGTPLEELGYRAHEKAGFMTSVNGKAVRDIKLDMRVTLSEAQAFQRAVQYTHTQDNTVRSGKKLIVSKGFSYAPESFVMAWQFDIDVSLIERWRVSIDANTGQLVNKVSLVNSCKHEPAKKAVSRTPRTTPAGVLPPYATGTALTSYYGTQTIQVNKEGNGSRLDGQTEHGGRINTLDFRNGPIIILLLGFPYTPSDFYDGDNTYTDAYQKPAVSVQWAAEQAYEYYFQKHNRNSFDNNGGKITNYVHVDVGLDNAFWTGRLLAFGDGSNNNPLVELDVVSHELTHGVTQYEAGLTYYNESGALNESFSDIMGKAIEFHTFGDTATWQLGRRHSSGGLRDFSNPNLKDQPDTYAGDLWYTGDGDNGGVHYNSGVQNFWFYLLCKGGSGVNDRQQSYTINAIGMEAAVNIAYRNLTEYLTSSADYLDSRIGSMLAAADLYGKNSTIYQQVDKAWDAVGVIDEPIIQSLEVYDILATTVKLKGNMQPRASYATYHFEYGTTPAYGNATPAYAYFDKIEASITGLQPQTKYYVRLVATNENGNAYTTTEFTTISPAPLVRIKPTVDVTETTATLYGEVNPNSLATSIYFEYGPTPALGMVTPTYPLNNASVYQPVSAPVTHLQPRQVYYYRVVATNSFATATSEAQSFITTLRPVILSYSPRNGPIGTEVTITGQNFNTTPNKNLVSFGATLGTVLSASATEIKVKVPAGASFGPLSVQDAASGLIAQSAQEFVPTFIGGYKKGDLQLSAGYNEGYVTNNTIQDMDGDGKPDIVGTFFPGFTILQNVNQGVEITEASFVRNTYSNAGFTTYDLFLADMDGNGLKDVIGSYNNGVRIYPNQSVAGYLFFGVPVDVPVGNLSNLSFADYDLDGHIDLAGTTYEAGVQTFRIFRNKNSKGTLSGSNFEELYAVAAPDIVYFLASSDLNNDGTPDVLMTNASKNFLWVLQNHSQPGAVAFDEKSIQDPLRGRGTTRYAANDLNGDGWKDLLSQSLSEAFNLGLLENKGTSPDITFAAPTLMLADDKQTTLQTGDINGDGKPDLLVANNRRLFSIFENKTEAGQQLAAASFEKFSEVGMPAPNWGSVSTQMAMGDLNGDGRPEVITSYGYYYGPHDGYQMEIWQNSPNVCIDPTQVKVSGVSSTTAQIELPPNTTFDEFEIEYRINSYDWGRIYYPKMEYLSRGWTYELRVRARCNLGFTEYHYITFTTECTDVDDFSIGIPEVDYVALQYSWQMGTLEIQYSPAGQDQWQSVPQYSYYIDELLPGTTYDVRYRVICNTPPAFKYKQFTTLCPALESFTLTELTYNSAVLWWQSYYQPATAHAVVEYSADDINWIPVGEDHKLSALVPGTQYTVRGKWACTSLDSDWITMVFVTPCPSISALQVTDTTPFSAAVRWADESNTGTYTVIYTELANNNTTTLEVSGTAVNLEGLTAGTQYSVSVAPVCAGEQRLINVHFTTLCYAPFNLAVAGITYTTAGLSWNSDFSGSPYFVDYSIRTSKEWKTLETTVTSVDLTDLRPGTAYEARVHIGCSSETPAYALVLFETNLYDQTRYAPNPTENTVTIQPAKSLIGNRFDIFDNMGRSVATGRLADYTFDFSTLAPGLYMLKIEGEDVMRIIRR